MIYITYVDLSDISYYGITKKIMSQIKILQKKFGKVYYTTYRGQMIYLIEGEIIIDKEVAITRERVNAIISDWLDKYKIQRTYIRYGFSNKWFLKFLKLQKEKKIKSVLEIPTYPYDGEVKNGWLKMEDNYYRDSLFQYVDYIATNSEADTILGISCIRLLNGVDIEKNPLCLKKKEEKKINLIGVSSMAIWHGYERILEGIFNYYNDSGDYKFFFKIVGNGPEEEKYRYLIEKYDLESSVKFYGILGGEELNREYETSDIAVSSLGLYKTGIKEVTPIKGAEYCARGIPFICGYYDMRFPPNMQYIMTVSNSPEPVNMHRVIAFYENITSQDGYHEEMRRYALNNFTWESIMSPIIEALM